MDVRRKRSMIEIVIDRWDQLFNGPRCCETFPSFLSLNYSSFLQLTVAFGCVLADAWTGYLINDCQTRGSSPVPCPLFHDDLVKSAGVSKHVALFSVSNPSY